MYEFYANDLLAGYSILVQQAFHWAQHYVNTEVNMSKLLLQLLPPTRLTTSLLLIKPAAEMWGTLFSVLLWWARHVLRFDITTWGEISQALMLILIFECSSVCVIIFLWGSFEGLFCLHFFCLCIKRVRRILLRCCFGERNSKYYCYCWKQWRLSFVYDRSDPHVDRHSGW